MPIVKDPDVLEGVYLKGILTKFGQHLGKAFYVCVAGVWRWFRL